MVYVYAILNTLTGKYYVGKSDKPFRRWSAHVKAAKSDSTFAFHEAIRSHGILSFEFRLLSTHDTDAEAFQAERESIVRFNSYVPNGYNETMGGEGSFGFRHTAEDRRIMSEKACGRKHTDISRKKMSDAKKGRKFSDEHRLNLSKSNVGKHNHVGENHPSASLTDSQVSEIRRLWKEEKTSREELRRMFNISYGVLSRLLSERTYRHLLSDPQEKPRCRRSCTICRESGHNKATCPCSNSYAPRGNVA